MREIALFGINEYVKKELKTKKRSDSIRVYEGKMYETFLKKQKKLEKKNTNQIRRSK